MFHKFFPILCLVFNLNQKHSARYHGGAMNVSGYYGHGPKTEVIPSSSQGALISTYHFCHKRYIVNIHR